MEPRVLTLNEVCGTFDEVPVWIQTVSTATPMIALYRSEHYPNIYFQRPVGETQYHLYSYGKSWRCWNMEPSPEQMKAAPWKMAECYLKGHCISETGACQGEPDEGCPVYRYFRNLLKEQEAVKPRVSCCEIRCGNCNKIIEMDGWKVCPWCGKPVKGR